MIGVVITLAAAIRRVPVLYWVMDLNPDQLIALGRLAPNSLAARFLDAIGRLVLRRADRIVVLDRFMADRIRSKVSLRVEPAIIPPWAHEAEIGASQDAAGFRTRHRLTGRFVVMYSGNHTTSNPLTTVLEAAVRLRDDDRIRFVFVGGGMGKKEVEDYRERYGLKNLLSLPYQPLAVLGDVLRTADLHVVSLGNAMVGIIHPSKVYGAMAAERPVLFLGPAPSHISELLDQHRFGWQVAHGDVAAAESLIRRLAAAPAAELAQSGGRGRAAIEHALSQRALCDHLCSIIEHTFSLTPGRERRPLGTAPASVH
jgi:colanic acid biosynthesis glycosyl transferase WcaI